LEIASVYAGVKFQVLICVDQKTKVNNMNEIDLVPDIDNTVATDESHVIFQEPPRPAVRYLLCRRDN